MFAGFLIVNIAKIKLSQNISAIQKVIYSLPQFKVFLSYHILWFKLLTKYSPYFILYYINQEKLHLLKLY